MLKLLLSIISYGATLLLLTPETVEDIILTAILFAVGAGLIVYKKAYKTDFLKKHRYFLIPAACLVTAYFGGIFYDRWLYSSKVFSIAAMIGMSVKTLLGIALAVCGVLTVYFVCNFFSMILDLCLDGNSRKRFLGNMFVCVAVSFVTVALSQYVIKLGLLSMGWLDFMFGLLVVTTVILFIYCLCGNIMISSSVGGSLFMLISTVNVYVYRFRGRLFEPVDIFSAGTATNVIDNYSLLPIPRNLIVAWVIFAVVLTAVYFLQRKADRRMKMTVKRRVLLLCFCAVASFSVFLYASNLQTYHWDVKGARRNGFILNFTAEFGEISVSKPEHYSTELIDGLAAEYGYANDEKQETPHIIVIMDESFSDLSVVGEFSTDNEVTPFISSLNENTVSGYAYSSVYGGNTANSEWEVLTGNSMAYLSENSVPYQQYIHSSSYSMVSYLKASYGYRCVAMHPYSATGWNRPAVYGYLGFDEWYFVEDFPQKDYIRNYVSDREMFEYLIKTYEEQKDEAPLFLFGVTMQNHGGYSYSGDNYTKSISLDDTDGEFQTVEQYLSLIHETDKAVEYLITYFQNADDDVIILFFGDHQPSITKTFYETVGNGTSDSLTEMQKRYKVPFFIWANYDIEEKYIDSTSLNYLSSYVYETAGISLPPYNRFLREMEKIVPAINSNGFWSTSEKRWLSLDKADDEEKSWLEAYEALQYNSIFDKKHRNEIFFPVLD